MSRTLDELFNLYLIPVESTHENKSEPSKEALTEEKQPMGKKSTKPGLLAHVNYHSKNLLGSVGRPAVVAAGSGYGYYQAGQYFGIDQLTNPWVAGGMGVGTAVGVEAGLHYFGDDRQLRIADGVDTFRDLSKTDTDPNELRETLLNQGIPEADVILFLTAFTAQQMKNQTLRVASGGKKIRKTGTDGE